MSAAVYCVVSTLPALGALIVLAAQMGPWTRQVLVEIATLLGALLGSCTWLAIFALHLLDLARGVHPSSLLFDWRGRIALVQLAIFVSLIGSQPFVRESTAALSYFMAHVVLLGWLILDMLARKIIGKVTLLTILAAALVFGVSVQRCPHSTTLFAFGVPVKVSGKWCGNPKQFRPWWMAFGPM